MEVNGNKKQKLQLNVSLPDPGKGPKPPEEVIPLPKHSTGMKGDSEIMNMDELNDIDLPDSSN